MSGSCLQLQSDPRRTGAGDRTGEPIETAPSHPNHRATTVWHTARMPDEHSPTSRQADRLLTAVANVESGLEVIVERVARLPTRKELWRAVLMGTMGGSAVRPSAQLIGAPPTASPGSPIHGSRLRLARG